MARVAAAAGAAQRRRGVTGSAEDDEKLDESPRPIPVNILHTSMERHTKAASGPLTTSVAICTQPTKERLTTILGPNRQQKRPKSCDLFHGGGIAQMVLELSFGHGLSIYGLTDNGQRGELGA